jgi:cation:H+ antiporter
MYYIYAHNLSYAPMLSSVLIFIAALTVLLFSAKFFTESAEAIGTWLKLPQFVIGIFIVGIGTSLPELVSGILSVRNGVSEILPGNIIGANISNILLVTGLAVAINRKPIELGSDYIYIDLHFLVGSFLMFYMIAYDGVIQFSEAFVGLFAFIVYAIYLIKGGTAETPEPNTSTAKASFPIKDLLILAGTAVGIYFSADYTISSISDIATGLNVPKSIIALTLLSLGTTLPELAVNITALRQGKAEMAIGNVLGSCVFNTFMIPALAATFGDITVPASLLSFSLPVMAACGLLFYLLTQDKRISVWEGLLLVMIYGLFLLKIAV